MNIFTFVQYFLVAVTPLSDLEQNSVLIGARIWYQTNPVTDLHDTRTRNRRRKKMESNYGTGFWSVCHGYMTKRLPKWTTMSNIDHPLTT